MKLRRHIVRDFERFCLKLVKVEVDRRIDDEAWFYYEILGLASGEWCGSVGFVVFHNGIGSIINNL